MVLRLLFCSVSAKRLRCSFSRWRLVGERLSPRSPPLGRQVTDRGQGISREEGNSTYGGQDWKST